MDSRGSSPPRWISLYATDCTICVCLCTHILICLYAQAWAYSYLINCCSLNVINNLLLQVLEFLLQVQTFEEKNYPVDRAEKALIVNNYNESETVLYLDTIQQLLNVGFHEDKIVQALARFGNDRDKVLDSLIS